MEHEDIELKVRSVEARERANEIEERKILIENKKSWRQSVAMICVPVITILGAVYFKVEKDHDIQSVNQSIQELKTEIHNNNCTVELAAQRRFYDNGDIGKIKELLRKIWAQNHIEQQIRESK